MIEGIVNEDDVPLIPLRLAGREWMAVVDTGFNGGLELPTAVQPEMGAIRLGPVISELAGGLKVAEDAYLVLVTFDGEERLVQATFAGESGVLLGTELMSRHHLEIDFPSKTVRLTRP